MIAQASLGDGTPDRGPALSGERMTKTAVARVVQRAPVRLGKFSVMRFVERIITAILVGMIQGIIVGWWIHR